MTESTKCPQCSGEMPANFPPGVCPACLLQQGMSPSTLTGAAGEESDFGAHASGPERRHSWTPPTPAELTPKFPQLEIAELLGQGGMGAVYKVRQKELDRWAALKILPGEVASDPNFAERFQREARALAQLSHQHIVTVYEFGQRDGVFFLLMEFVDGVTLRQAGRAGQVTAKDALGIVTQLCDALQFAHEEGIVHRDIKPENILIDKRGRVKIADFGLAKLLGKQASFPSLTGTHQIMGTPVYMAPEQMEGTKGVDHRADIFSLGVVFYELLTGELPLGRFAPPSQKYSLDVRLDEVVLRTLEKNPDRRYQQASDVRCDVEMIRSQPIAAAVGVATKGRNHVRTTWRSHLKNPVVLLSLGCLPVLCILMPAMFYGTYLNFRFALQDTSADAARSRAAMKQYAAQVGMLQQEQEQQAREADGRAKLDAARDPFEANAIVQFTADGVKLHTNFGVGELDAAQRQAIERIMRQMHKHYLVYESRVSKHETAADGSQVVTIEKIDSETSTLEHDFWTVIDSAVPVAQQKFLRQHLPLYADAGRNRVMGMSRPHPFLMESGANMLAGGGFGGGASPSSGMMSMAGGLEGGSSAFPGAVRYPQLFGWKPHQLPLRVTIRRRGKWFRWEIEELKPAVLDRSAFDERVHNLYVSGQMLDSGEAPELPSGLKRFWREAGSDGAVSSGSDSAFGPPKYPNDTPEAAFQRAKQAYAACEWQTFADCFTDEARDEWAFEQLSSVTVPNDGDVFALSGGTKFKQFVQSMEKTYPKVRLQSPETEAKIFAIHVKLRKNRYSRTERRAIAAQFVRELFGNQPRDFFIHVTEFFHSAFPDRGGFEDLMLQPTEGLDQQTSAFGTYAAKGAVVRLPIWFNRKDPGSGWAIDGLVDFSFLKQSDVSDAQTRTFAPEPKPPSNPSAATDDNLDAKLLQMDKLRAADQTPWDEVEKLANELLAKYTAPADKGRIHWMAAHVYGQSDIRGHAADVIRHAQEALRYERDPVQRGWLFMYLGDASGLIARRDEATRWYLKGYLELLPFNLPDKAPELPPVGKFGGDLRDSSDGEVDPELIAIEVKRAAEMKARQDAEFTRELVSRRDIYIRQLADLDARGNPLDGKDVKPESQLRAIASEVLRDQTAIEQLLKRVALSKPILGEKPPD